MCPSAGQERKPSNSFLLFPGPTPTEEPGWPKLCAEVSGVVDSDAPDLVPSVLVS